jgi:hypothetical protein
VMDPIPDLNGDLALEQHELLVLACVEVQREPHPRGSSDSQTPNRPSLCDARTCTTTLVPANHTTDSLDAWKADADGDGEILQGRCRRRTSRSFGELPT